MATRCYATTSTSTLTRVPARRLLTSLPSRWPETRSPPTLSSSGFFPRLHRSVADRHAGQPSHHQQRLASTKTKAPLKKATIALPDLDPDVKLSAEQLAVLELVKDGKSVFFTGSAGTGKSLLLKHIIHSLLSPSSSGVRREVAVTSSTGTASVQLNGRTLHSWAGIGRGAEDAETIYNTWKGYKKSKRLNTWRGTDVLIIDEISMIDGYLFDKLEKLARLIRGNDLPFGGIQVVAVGDFFQLPPVPDRDTVGKPLKFAFEAEGWKRTFTEEIDLKEVFRQKDPAFVSLLDEMRYGRLSPKNAALLASLSRPIAYEDGIAPTELYSVNSQADRANLLHLAALRNTPLHEFYSADIRGVDQNETSAPFHKIKATLASSGASEKLQLKIGATVMLTQNSEDHHTTGLVNGSVGRVVSFHDPETCLKDLPPGTKAFIGYKGKKTLHAPHEEPKRELHYPLVEFLVRGKRLQRYIYPSSFTAHETDGKTVFAFRIQLPLILAWAVSIHKSQGKTLDRVKVDFSRIFEKGQAYVAASRCRSLETLQILHFNEAMVKPHPAVLKWALDREARAAARSSTDVSSNTAS